MTYDELDNTDRNRTSPFAFTGNRFEFRAVGSSANCAGALTTLNAAVAEQLVAFKRDVDARMADGRPVNVAVMDALKPLIASVIDTVCFEGNGYTEEWKAEAVRRAADSLRAAQQAIRDGITPDAVLIELEAAMEAIGELTGRTVREDVTQRIFERFCVGK